MPQDPKNPYGRPYGSMWPPAFVDTRGKPAPTLPELAARVGIEPGSPLGKASRLPGKAIEGLQSALPAAWQYLAKESKSPQVATPEPIAPSAGPMALGPILAGPAEEPGMQVPEGATSVPSFFDPNKGGGWLRREIGQGLSGVDWASSQRDNQGASKPFTRPLEELYKIGGMPMDGPTSVAPGAREMAQRELLDRVGPSEFERFKSSIPLQQADITGKYGLEQQREQSRGALAVEQETQRGGESKARSLVDLYGMLQPGGRVSIPGAGSISAPSERNINTLLNQLTMAKEGLAAARERDARMGGLGSSEGVAPAEARFKQALGNVFSQVSDNSDLQEAAVQVALDPELSKLPFSQLLQQGITYEDGSTLDMTKLDEMELNQLNTMLNYARGAAY